MYRHCWLAKRNRGALVTLTHLGVGALLACGEAPEPEQQKLDAVEEPIIYGTDDRRDVYAATDKNLAAIAKRTTVGMVWRGSLSTDSLGKVSVNGSKLSDPNGIGLRSEWGAEVGRGQLCPGEAFADDRAGVHCSGTLIAEDLVLTAGHCVDELPCGDAQFVFGHYRDSASALHEIGTADVFDCQSVVVRGAHEQSTGMENSLSAASDPGVSFVGGVNTTVTGDFAIVRLNRKALKFASARVPAEARQVAVGTRVGMAGFPLGIPLKVSDGGKVTSPVGITFPGEDIWESNLDSYPGNSGSGVYALTDYALKGILVMGNPNNFELDPARGCYRLRVVGETASGVTEMQTYAWKAMQALCGFEPNNAACVAKEQLKFAAASTDNAKQNTRNQWLYLGSGQKLVVSHCGANASFTGDTFLRLFDNQGVEVAFNDDKDPSTCGFGSELQFVAASAGLYEVRQGCYSVGNCGGTATFSVQDVPAYLEAECATTKSGAYKNTLTQDMGFSGSGHITSVANSQTDLPGTTNVDRATYRFGVPLSAAYNLFFRVNTHGNGSQDSWFYRVDSGAWAMVNDASSLGAVWGWKKGVAAVSLSPGAHTLELVNREGGLSVDKIAVLPTSSAAPTGLGLAGVNACN